MHLLAAGNSMLLFESQVIDMQNEADDDEDDSSGYGEDSEVCYYFGCIFMLMPWREKNKQDL